MTEAQERAAAEKDPLRYPHRFHEGTQWQEDDGTIYTVTNGQWA